MPRLRWIFYLLYDRKSPCLTTILENIVFTFPSIQEANPSQGSASSTIMLWTFNDFILPLCRDLGSCRLSTGLPTTGFSGLGTLGWWFRRCVFFPQGWGPKSPSTKWSYRGLKSGLTINEFPWSYFVTPTCNCLFDPPCNGVIYRFTRCYLLMRSNFW